MNNQSIVEMFRKDLESYTTELKQKQELIGKFPQTHPDVFLEMHQLSIIVRYLSNKFDNIEIIEQLKKEGKY